MDSLRNKNTKRLLNFDDSCEEICNSRAFADFATAGKDPGVNTVYINHNLFQRSKIRRDVELQNMHIFLFISLRVAVQTSTLSAQLGLGSNLVDWCRDRNFCSLRSFID